jgi:hypothetical protein
MYVHRMDEVVMGTNKANLQSLSDLHVDRVSRRVRFTVDREVVGKSPSMNIAG